VATAMMATLTEVLVMEILAIVELFCSLLATGDSSAALHLLDPEIKWTEALCPDDRRPHDGNAANRATVGKSATEKTARHSTKPIA
jgi:hypothetical protein